MVLRGRLRGRVGRRRFLVITSVHCLNLGSAVNMVLYDRLVTLGVTDRHDIGIANAQGRKG